MPRQERDSLSIPPEGNGSDRLPQRIPRRIVLRRIMQFGIGGRIAVFYGLDSDNSARANNRTIKVSPVSGQLDGRISGMDRVTNKADRGKLESGSAHLEDTTSYHGSTLFGNNNSSLIQDISLIGLLAVGRNLIGKIQERIQKVKREKITKAQSSRGTQSGTKNADSSPTPDSTTYRLPSIPDNPDGVNSKLRFPLPVRMRLEGRVTSAAIEAYENVVKSEQQAREAAQKRVEENEMQVEHHRQREIRVGQETCRALEERLKQDGIDQLASHVWGISPTFTHVPNDTIMEDGVIRKHSHVVIYRSYEYPVAVYHAPMPLGYSRKDNGMSKAYYIDFPHTHKDRIGMGYIDSRAFIVEEAKQSVSDDQLIGGVLCYEVNYKHIPVHFPDATILP